MSISQHTQELHVAPTGRDDACGDARHPLASLASARDRLRGQQPAGATIWLHGGVYQLDESFTLTEEDSGTESAPVVYRAWPGEEVRISGGRYLDGGAFRPVSDKAVLERQEPAVRGHLLELDLAACGITDTGGRTGYGFAFPVVPADLEVYYQDRPLPVARWPREGYALTGPVLDPGSKMNDPANGPLGLDGADVRGATFTGDAERLRRWSRPGDLACFGMWGHDWSPATIPVQSVDIERGLITLAFPSYGGVKDGRKYFVRNVLEEIGAPGEWAVDRTASILYLYPPEPLAGKWLLVSVLQAPLIALRGARFVTFRDLIIEGGRGPGIVIDGDDNLVAGCTLRNLGGRGVLVNGSRNRIQSCHLHALGQGGITLSGGDRRELIPGENVADNNEIHDVNRVCTTYNPGVHLNGCGHRVSHNAIYDGPHNAILLHGNDHLIEYNEIHHVALDTDDAAAFYMGRNPSEQGNVIQYNYFHHIGSPSGWGTSAIYPDDGASGLTVRGNVFYRCGHDGQVCMGAIFNNAGKDHLIENNIFVDCRICFGQMLMLQPKWEEFLRGEEPHVRYMYDRLYTQVDIRSEVYLRRYPWLAELSANATSNTVRRNLAVRCGVLVTPEDRQQVQDNWMTDTDPGFADMARLNFALAPDSEAARRIPGFQPVPFAAMGLRVDAYRPKLPAPVLVDCRPEMTEQPQVQRPGEEARAVLTLHLANLSAATVSVPVELWTTQPESVRFIQPPSLEFALAPNEVRQEKVELAVAARPDLAPLVGAHAHGSRFSLPVSVRPRYRVELARRVEAVEPGDLASTLAAVPALSFLQANGAVGELRAMIAGEMLALHARLNDRRPFAGTAPADFWNSAYLGILAAPPEATDTAAVRQPIFFPHGPGEGGTLWYFAGHRQVEPDAVIRWSAAQREDGWELSALVPLSALGLPAEVAGFRLEAMANLVLAPEEKPRLVTLFGSKPARLELGTLAEVTIR
ncbi:MAG: right-handed parallel beta-helix repeat-containing protein [Armatimonadota bacterium]